MLRGVFSPQVIPGQGSRSTSRERNGSRRCHQASASIPCGILRSRILQPRIRSRLLCLLLMVTAAGIFIVAGGECQSLELFLRLSRLTLACARLRCSMGGRKPLRMCIWRLLPCSACRRLVGCCSWLRLSIGTGTPLRLLRICRGRGHRIEIGAHH